MSPDEIIAHLDRRGLDPKACGPSKWQARCPAHDDHKPSLAISEGTDDRTLLHCHAGCEVEDILAAVGLTTADLFTSNGHGATRLAKRRVAEPDPLPTEADLEAWASQLSPAIAERLEKRRGWTAQALATLGVGYADRELKLPVRDQHGELVNVIRLSGPELKPFALYGRRRDLWPPVEAIPTGERIFVCEGEKDVLSLRSMDAAGVAVPGTNGWRSEYAPRFAGRDVVLMPDCDGKGRELMKRVAGYLVSHAASVRILDLDPGREDGHDVGDELMQGLAAGGTHEDVADLLRKAADATELFQPVIGRAQQPELPADSDPPVAAAEPKVLKGRRITLTTASAVEPEAVRWAWDERLPLGALSLIAGQPGLGKSTTTIHLAARLSRGELEGALYGKPCDVLFVTLEDHIASVVRPRLEVAGADLGRVHFLDVREEGQDGLLTLPDDLRAIEGAAERLQARLLVIDPIVATLGSSTDSHKDQSVRRALAPLAQYAERSDVAVVGVMHMTKAEADGLLNRVSGSVAFGGAARSVFAFARDPDDPDGEAGYGRLLVHAKTNWGRYARTLQCRIDTGVIETRSGASEQSLLTVLGECDVTGADLSQKAEPGELDDATEFLEEHLSDGGWHPKREVKKLADAQRLAWRTVQRAAQRLGVDYEKQGFPAVSMWRLPVAPSPVGATAGATGWRDCKRGSTEPDMEGADSSRAKHPDVGATGQNGAQIEAPATAEQEALAARLRGVSEDWA